jgi:hypothetical protein
VLADVRVVLPDQLAVSLLDVVGGRGPFDTKCLVVVLVFHELAPGWYSDGCFGFTCGQKLVFQLLDGVLGIDTHIAMWKLNRQNVLNFRS